MQQPDEHILIVEDSEYNAQVLSYAISGLAPVTIAKTGAEALLALAEQDFAVVLLDIMLPTPPRGQPPMPRPPFL